MVWPLASRNEQENAGDVSVATQDAWKNIPQTPGAASWAFKSIPTIFFGTPKPKENADIFRDITNNIEAATKRVPATPGEKKFERPNGILKTPGTTGPAKNVSFAHFKIEESDADTTMSPSIRKSTKIERIRSGLPANFPGKFPSPWTPKVVRYDEAEDLLENSPEINREAKLEESNNVPTEFTDNAEHDGRSVESIISLIMENNKKLEELADGRGSPQTTIDMGYQELIQELKEQSDYAIDYAKRRDQEVVTYRAQLTELMEEHNELLKNQEKSNKNGPIAEEEEVKEQSSELIKAKIALDRKDLELGRLKEEISELKLDRDKLASANIELEKETQNRTDLQSRHEPGESKLLERTNKDLQRRIAELEKDKRSMEAQKRIDDMKLKRVQSLEDENAKMQAQMSELRNSEADSHKIKLLNYQIADLKDELDTSRSREKQLSLEIEKLQRNEGQKESKNSELVSHAQMLAQKLSAKDNQMLQSQRDSENQRDELRRLREQNLTDMQVMHELKMDKTRLSETVERLDRELQQLKIAKVPDQRPALLWDNGDEKPALLRKTSNTERNAKTATTTSKPSLLFASRAVSPVAARLQSPKPRTFKSPSLFKEVSPSSSTSSAAAVKDQQYTNTEKFNTFPRAKPITPVEAFEDIASDFQSNNMSLTSPVDMRFDNSVKDVTMKDVTMISQTSFDVLGDASKADAARRRLNDSARIEASRRRLEQKFGNSPRNSSRASTASVQ